MKRAASAARKGGEKMAAPKKPRDSTINKTMYRQKCFILLSLRYEGTDKELAHELGCTVLTATTYRRRWDAMNSTQRREALEKALREIRVAARIYPETNIQQYAAEPEKPKPEPAVKWGFRSPKAVANQPRSRTPISHY